MKVEEFSLAFTLNNREINAVCSKFQVYSYPQIRVTIGEFPRNQWFNFYLLSNEIFWFELPVTTEPTATAIAHELSKKYKLPYPTRPGTIPM